MDSDPAPVEVLCPQGASPFLLSAEHAGRAFPKRLGTLGVSHADLRRHIVWDIGIAGVTRHLSQRLDAPAVLQTYSRLVVDCNRWPEAEDFVTTFSEDIAALFVRRGRGGWFCAAGGRLRVVVG